MGKKIKFLDGEINLIQMEKFIIDFKKAMKKEHKKTLKRILTLVLPTIIFVVGIVVFPETITMVIGSSMMTIAFICDHFIENDIKFKHKNNKSKDKIVILNDKNVNNDENVEEVLKKGIPGIEEFYSQMTKDKVDNAKKRKQQNKTIQNNKPNITVLSKDNVEKKASKEEIMIQIAEEINLYYEAYKINEWKVTAKQWQFLFDTLYDLFVEKQLEDIFYEKISKLCRVTLSRAIVYNYKNVTIKDFVDNLDALQKDESQKKIFNDKEILIIQKKILTSVYQTKIVNINSHIKKKTKNK